MPHFPGFARCVSRARCETQRANPESSTFRLLTPFCLSLSLSLSLPRTTPPSHTRHQASAQLTATSIFKPQNESIKSAVASNLKKELVGKVTALRNQTTQVRTKKRGREDKAFFRRVKTKKTFFFSPPPDHSTRRVNTHRNTQFKKQVQTTPARAIAIANATNTTVDPKLLQLQTLNAKYTGKKAEVD